MKKNGLRKQMRIFKEEIAALVALADSVDDIEEDDVIWRPGAKDVLAVAKAVRKRIAIEQARLDREKPTPPPMEPGELRLGVTKDEVEKSFPDQTIMGAEDLETVLGPAVQGTQPPAVERTNQTIHDLVMSSLLQQHPSMSKVTAIMVLTDRVIVVGAPGVVTPNCVAIEGRLLEAWGTPLQVFYVGDSRGGGVYLGGLPTKGIVVEDLKVTEMVPAPLGGLMSKYPVKLTSAEERLVGLAEGPDVEDPRLARLRDVLEAASAARTLLDRGLALKVGNPTHDALIEALDALQPGDASDQYPEINYTHVALVEPPGPYPGTGAKIESPHASKLKRAINTARGNPSPPTKPTEFADDDGPCRLPWGAEEE